jgi:Flp pilus assembly protein TadG
VNRRNREGRGKEAGNAAVELAPVALVLIIMLALAIFTGRVVTARNAVADAASEAARQASIARTPAQAQDSAVTTAESVLAADHLDCAPAVTVDTAGFADPAGQPAQVSVQVTCDVQLSGLAVIPGIPGSRTLTATASSPLDVYRAR